MIFLNSTEEIRVKAIAGAEALYRLTEARNFDSALKFELRKKASEVISGVAGLILNISNRRETADDLFAAIAGIAELLDFSSNLGFIIPDNAEKVAKTYLRIKEFVGDSYRAGGDGGTSAPEPETQKKEEDRVKAGDARTTLPEESPRENVKAALGAADEKVSSPAAAGAQILNQDQLTVNEPTVNERQERILWYLRDNGKAQIGDIRVVFEDISEKTLQRDLWHLVNCGLVQRDGDYRWTAYTYIGHL